MEARHPAHLVYAKRDVQPTRPNARVCPRSLQTFCVPVQMISKPLYPPLQLPLATHSIYPSPLKMLSLGSLSSLPPSHLKLQDKVDLELRTGMAVDSQQLAIEVTACNTSF